MVRAERAVEMPSSLCDRAIELLTERFGVADWRVLPARAARKSTIIRLHSDAAGKSAALKIYARELRRGEGPGLQVAALERFQPLLAGNRDGFDLPEVYAYFPASSAVVIEWVPARQLEQVLVRAAVTPRAHWRAVALAGRWLRHFHEASGLNEAGFEPARYSRLLDKRIAAHPEAVAALAGDRLWGAATRRFERMAELLRGYPVTMAVTHGDFTSTNLLIGPRRVTGIDLWAERRAPIVDDLARMFVYLAMGDPLPIAARLGAVPLEQRRAMRALFEGYGEDVSPDGLVWRHVVMFEALARWIALSARLVRRGSFTERWKSAGLRRLLLTLLQTED